MTRFLAEVRSELSSKVQFVIWLLISVALGILGPFGSYGALSLAERLAFWTPMAALGLVLTTSVRALINGPLRLRGTVRGMFLAVVLICAGYAPPLYLTLLALFANRGTQFPSFGELVLLVGSVSLGVGALRRSLGVDQAEMPPVPEVVLPDEPDEEPSRLMRRVEPGQRGDLWSISVRDHYVEVVTSRGTVSLLMRLSDAITEAEPVSGVQVHRSHWVAWGAIDGLERDSGRLFLQVRGGQRIPVSRAHREKVEGQVPAVLAQAGE